MSESTARVKRSLVIGGGITAGATIVAILSPTGDTGPVIRAARALFTPGDILARAIYPGWHLPRTSELLIGVLGTAALYTLLAWAVLAVFRRRSRNQTSK